MVVKAPLCNEAVSLDPEGLVDNIVLPPEELRKLMCVAGSDGSAAITVCDVGVFNVGSGECKPKCLESGSVPVATTSQRNDLQAQDSVSLPVENRYGNHVDTNRLDATQKIRNKQGQVKRDRVENVTSTINCKRDIQRNTQMLGYVPIQVVNLSLEELELKKQTYIGVSSPVHVNEIQVIERYDVNITRREPNATQGNFEEYLNEKLTHLDKKDRYILEAVLRRCKQLFYGLGSKELGCTSQIEHSIETGDAKPIKKSPYRIPHALKPVVDEHVDGMLQRNFIEPITSPWSSSIVLVQDKSKDRSVKYRFCIDYRSLNAVTRPDAYPIPNIVDTFDSLGKCNIFFVLDMVSGYHQIAVKPKHKEKTAFS
jgi:hypothetical protein